MRRTAVTLATVVATIISTLTLAASPALATDPAVVPALGDRYAVLAEDGAALVGGFKLDTGAIGVRRSTGGPYLTATAADLVVGAGTVVRDATAVTVAGTVSSARGSRVGVLVHDGGTVRGRSTQEVTPAGLPVSAVIPAVGAPTVGKRDIVATANRGLVAGAYRDLRISAGVTVRLRGGAYSFASVTLDPGARLRYEAAAEVVVAGRITVGDGAWVLPVPGRGLTGTDLLLATSAAAASPADPPVVQVGSTTRVRASVRAPRGTVSVGASTLVQGSLAGRWVLVGADVRMRFEPPAVTGGAPEITVAAPVVGTVLQAPTTLVAALAGGAAPFTVAWALDETPIGAGAELLWDPASVAPGAHVLTATVTDAHGRTSTSPGAPVTVVDPTDADLVLAQDRASGALSADDYARAVVYRQIDPARVDPRYVPDAAAASEDLTTALLPAFQGWDDLAPETRDELLDALVPTGLAEEPEPMTAQDEAQLLADQDEAIAGPPTEEEPPEEEPGGDAPDPGAAARSGSADVAGIIIPTPPVPKTRGSQVCSERARYPRMPNSPVVRRCTYTTYFATFTYETATPGNDDAVPTEDLVDARMWIALPNGIPDLVDATAEAYRQALVTYKSMGFSSTPKVRVDIGQYDRAVSLPVVKYVTVSQDRPVYVMQHELFHQFEYEYTNPLTVGTDTIPLTHNTVGWWLEASAEWATDKAQSTVVGLAADSEWFVADRTDYSLNIDGFMDAPNRALTRFSQTPDADHNLPQYGAFVFAEYLEHRFGWEAVHDTWETAGAFMRPIDAIARVATDRGSSLSEVVHDFWAAYDVPVLGAQFGDLYGWMARLDGERPHHETVRSSETGKLTTRTLALEPGGVIYLDLPMGGATDQTVDVSVTVTGGEGFVGDAQAEVVHRRAENLTTYDAERCQKREQTQEIALADGAGSFSTTVFPGCAVPTVRVGWPDAHDFDISWFPLPTFATPSLSVQVTVRTAPFVGTVEETFDSGLQHRVEDAPQMGTPRPDGTFAFDVDYRYDPAEQLVNGLCFWGTVPAGAMTVRINGAESSLNATRYVTEEGRFRYLFSWRPSSMQLTCLLPPADAFVSGVNHIEIEARSGVWVHAAFLESYPYVPPGEEPEPCTDDCGPTDS